MKQIFVAVLAVFFLFSAILSATAEGLKAGDVDPKNGKVIKYWAAPMDPTYIRNEPGQSPMGMDLVPVYQEADGEKLPASTIRIDPVTAQNMGVRTATVKQMELKKSIRALGTVTYDETRIFAVNLKFDGWIEKLHVDFVGEGVSKGQPLFEIYSPELFTAQEEFLLAQSQAKSLAASSYPSVRENATMLLRAARQRLKYWDLEDKQIKQLEKRGRVKKNLTIYSPVNGVVIKKDALAGHYVKAGMHQYEIADLSRVWVDVEVYEYELPFIKKGMPAGMELSYLPGKRFEGTILFIYPFLNPETRTVKLRLAFDNKERLLKPDMYANVYVESMIDPAALVIPQEAVLDSGLRKVVFVARGEGKFELRPVKLGLEGENSTFQVLEGLQEGENIVTSAQFMFDSESRLREAIQKMLDARTGDSNQLSADDLDMGDMKMDDSDLDMSDMKMDN
ncbi:MAG: efflux RND transporter periplasmic adaptor subunit [Desulfobulbaceae bacterium]|nr:efflux RND transporter periplasmic adaptor subunit [Desulfobulbaceae bacterium]